MPRGVILLFTYLLLTYHLRPYFFYLSQQFRIEVCLHIERSEEATPDVLAADINLYTRYLLYVQTGSLVHQRMVFLQFGISDDGNRESSLAQAAGVLRAQGQEDFKAVALRGEEESQHVGIRREGLAHTLYPAVLQVVHVDGDHGVVTYQRVGLAHRVVITRQREERQLLLDGVGFGEVAQPQLLLHLMHCREVSAATDIRE